MAYHQGGHLQAAAHHYQTVLQSAPRDFHALRLLGIVRLQQGNFPEAEKLLSKAVKQNGNSGDTYYYLGRIGRKFGAALCRSAFILITLTPAYAGARACTLARRSLSPK